MDDLLKLERRVQSLYNKSLRTPANRLSFELPISEKDASGLPSVLFLGNHSSGKSSFINYLIGTNLQKSGLAPTDDGFTIITYGETRDEFDGQTVTTHPDLAYKRLQRLGPAFLSRLRLKTLPNELLKSLTLIDSPGMIDAAGTANRRGYDFTASVRHFAETADLILCFFDPDKPGTTGETISIFTETLAGLEYKLLIVLNKVDLFANIRDFARTYGTLCWNLSKTIKTKDIPHIFNTYLPNLAQTPTGGNGRAISLNDFDVSRDEVIAEINRTPTRRADNLVSDLYNNARKLNMHGRVCYEIARSFRSLRNKIAALVPAILAVVGLLLWLRWEADTLSTKFLVGFLGAALAAGVGFAGRFYLNRLKERFTSPEGINRYFERAYRDELVMHERADLRALWANIRKQTVSAVKVLTPNGIPSTYSLRKMLRRLDQIIENDIPNLRRDIAAYHKSRREDREEQRDPAAEPAGSRSE